MKVDVGSYGSVDLLEQSLNNHVTEYLKTKRWTKQKRNEFKIHASRVLATATDVAHDNMTVRGADWDDATGTQVTVYFRN